MKLLSSACFLVRFRTELDYGFIEADRKIEHSPMALLVGGWCLGPVLPIIPQYCYETGFWECSDEGSDVVV